MSRLSPFLYVLLVPVLTVACQATVNVTEATDTDTDNGDSSKSDSNDESAAAADDETGQCVTGDEGCACYGNGTCNGDLVCNESLCEQPPGSSTGTTGDSSADTAGDTTLDTSGGISSDTSSDSSGRTTDDTSSSTANDTSGDTTGTTSDDTTGSTGDSTTGGDPDCGNVPADMVCVPADTFEMGTSLNVFLNQQISASEKPGHMVTLTKTYWMDRTEVTVEDYAKCWALQQCTLPMQGQGYTWGMANQEKHPINGVDWYQAKKYCEWKGKRLATEAEWELAARGTDGRMYPWGNAKPTCEYMVSDSCGTSGMQAVGSKPLGVSPYGALDMGGNVSEWCADYYKEDYYYESPVVDPQGPAVGTKRVARSFAPPLTDIETAVYGRATLRVGYSPLLADVNPAVMGIRCVQTPP